MKLVEPGPALPPFEVEYSALESDSKPVEHTPEPDVLAIDKPAVDAAEGQGSPAAATVDVTQVDASGNSPTTSSSESQPAGSLPSESQESRTQTPETEPSGGDAFGAGVDVGDAPAKSPVGTEPKEPGASESDPNRKKGKRPNRRRRSRRNQKKNNGSSSSGDSAAGGDS